MIIINHYRKIGFSHAEIAKILKGSYQQKISLYEERLAAMQIKREEYVEEKRQVMATRLDVPKLNRLQMAVEAMDAQIVRQKQNVKKAEMAVRAAEERLVESMTERKTQERLRENAFEVYRQEMNAEEQKEIDERTSFRYGTTEAEEA